VLRCDAPTGTDVAETVIFEDIPVSVKGNPLFSRILQDEVYPLALDRALRHPFAT